METYRERDVLKVPKSRRVKEKSSLHLNVFPVSRPSRITHNAVTSVFKGGEKQESFHTSVNFNEELATAWPGKSTSSNRRQWGATSDVLPLAAALTASYFPTAPGLTIEEQQTYSSGPSYTPADLYALTKRMVAPLKHRFLCPSSSRYPGCHRQRYDGLSSSHFQLRALHPSINLSSRSSSH